MRFFPSPISPLKDCDPYQVRVAVHIARVAGGDGACWEALRTIAAKTHMSVGKASQARRSLHARGIIVEAPKGYRLADGVKTIMLPHAVDELPLRPPAWRFVYELILLSGPDGQPIFYRSVREWAGRLGISPSHVVRVRDELIRNGYIIVRGDEWELNLTGRKKKEKAPLHPAVAIWRDVHHAATGKWRNPNRMAAKLIVANVGDAEQDLEYWRKVLEEWAANGWNLTNVSGQVDRFLKTKPKRLLLPAIAQAVKEDVEETLPPIGGVA